MDFGNETYFPTFTSTTDASFRASPSHIGDALSDFIDEWEQGKKAELASWKPNFANEMEEDKTRREVGWGSYIYNVSSSFEGGLTKQEDKGVDFGNETRS